jgi:dTDP-4-amino-4,6-dideoxygalactose transaminase
MAINFIDLAAQQAGIRARLDKAISDVLDQGKYIMGPQVKQFEAELADFCGAGHALSCANGTDALSLALMALDVKTGDAVFVPSFTFAATAEVVPFIGATPIFVDVRPDTFNMDVESLKRGIQEARKLGLNPKCVISVDLFGLAADFDPIMAIARENGMSVIDDAAQGFGARYHGRVTGAIGDITTTSFFPAKPLGCYGDGGAVFTQDEELARLIDSYRVHGKGSHKYDNERIGMNSRLDTLQAAILIEKLAVFPEEIEKRQAVAARYTEALSDIYDTPYVPDGLVSTWAQYTLKTESNLARTALQEKAKTAGVPTVVYYPIPLHAQTAFRSYPRDPQGLAVSEDLASRVLSLPMHPYLNVETQDQVIQALRGRSNANLARDRR